MTRQLILHIGPPKTGTTSIQRTLVASQNALLSRGILHPDTTPHKHNHRNLIPYLTSSDTSEELPDTVQAAKVLWEGIVQEIERTDPHTIILSSEQLFRVWSPEQAQAITAKLRAVASHITIVAYVREPAASTLSATASV